MSELKKAFYFSKSNDIPGYDDISYNVIKKCFGSLCEPLKYLFKTKHLVYIVPRSYGSRIYAYSQQSYFHWNMVLV